MGLIIEKVTEATRLWASVCIKGSRIMFGEDKGDVYMIDLENSEYNKIAYPTGVPSGTGGVWLYWYAVATENDIAIAGQHTGKLYISEDYGITWNDRSPNAGNRNYLAATIETVGETTSIVVGDNQGIYKSTDLGLNWSRLDPIGDDFSFGKFFSIDVDGVNYVAADYGDQTWLEGGIYTSTDSGATWTERYPVGDTRQEWYAVAIDGDYILAGVNGGRLYLSTNKGVTWNEIQPAGNNNFHWRSVAITGNLMLAGIDCGQDGVYGIGRLYISTNYGETWEEIQPYGDEDKQWLNAEGDNGIIVVAVFGGEVWKISVDISVTTNASSQIAYHCAIGNGEIASLTNATERGFETRVYVDYFGVGGDIVWGMMGFHDEGDIVYHDFGQRTGYLVKKDYLEGDFEEGIFEDVLGYRGVVYDIWGEPDYVFCDMLEKCTSYTYRAYAIIGGVTYYGEYVAFDTLCDAGGDQQLIDDISEGNPVEPIIPIEPEPIIPIEPGYPPYEYPPEMPYPPWDWSYPPWDYDLPELPPWVDPDYPDLPPLPPWYLPDLPPWEYPDYPPMSFVGDFYYRKPYTQKDLNELRQKCIIYNKNSIEFALVLRHNMNVLKEFFNMMTDYMEKDEFNDFTDLIPPQRLKELYLEPLGVNDFRDIINEFIRNTVNDNISVNRNFKLLAEGLDDEYQTNDTQANFKEIISSIKTLEQDDPDVERMKRLIDSLNQEVYINFNNIMDNLKILKARLL